MANLATLPVIGDTKTTWSTPDALLLLDRFSQDLDTHILGHHSRIQASTEVAVFALSPVIQGLGQDAHQGAHYLGCVASVFLCQLRGVDLPEGMYPRTAKKPWSHPVLLADVTLWQTVYRALQRINELGLWGYPYPIVHPGYALRLMGQEGLLISMAAADTDMSNTKARIEAEQSINRKLREFGRKTKNPFPKHSLSDVFIEICFHILSKPQKYGDFEKTHWSVMLKARTDYLAALKRSKPRVVSIETGKITRSQVAKRKK
jgi:hypothetical protein